MMPELPWVKDAASAWRYAKNMIDLYGEPIITEDRAMTREVQNLLITIKNPLEGFPVAGSGWDMPALETYAAQFLDPSPAGFDYTYGERIHERSQLEYAVRCLAENKTSRRAVIKTWRPCRDHFEQHVPCLQLLDLLVRNNQLNLTAVFRSHDIGRAYVSNVYGLGQLMKYISGIINVPVGTLTTHSISAHIYEV